MPKRRSKFYEDVFEFPLTQQERTVLAFIREGDGVTTRQIAKLLYGVDTRPAALRVRILLRHIRRKLEGSGWTVPVGPSNGKAAKHFVIEVHNGQ